MPDNDRSLWTRHSHGIRRVSHCWQLLLCSGPNRIILVGKASLIVARNGIRREVECEFANANFQVFHFHAVTAFSLREGGKSVPEIFGGKSVVVLGD